MGPLDGVRVIEIAGLGPAPFAAMLLADMGAEVVRIDRTGGGADPAAKRYAMHRGRRSIALDLKHPRGADTILRLVERCGRADRGLPSRRHGTPRSRSRRLPRAQPRLVYGRMTGWGQDGPLASAAGHDINYIALAGALRNFAPAR